MYKQGTRIKFKFGNEVKQGVVKMAQTLSYEGLEGNCAYVVEVYNDGKPEIWNVFSSDVLGRIFDNEEVYGEELSGLGKLSKMIHEANVLKGFYDKPRPLPESIALIHSEVSEALEADRRARRADLETFEGILSSHGDFRVAFEMQVKDTVEDELADTLIRVLDLCAYMGIDIDKHVALKIKYNATRPKRHGKNY